MSNRLVWLDSMLEAERQEEAGTRATQRAADLLFGAPILLAAFLLFASEPMAAKDLLPAFGGASSVWLTALLFFQSDLLLGYLYALWLVRQKPRTANRVYLLVLVLSVAAALYSAGSTTRQLRVPSLMAESAPTLGILLLLTLRLGLPFLLLASTSPLLQVWYRRVSHGALPYRWYGLANLGSLAALLLYPLLVEPWIPLRWQHWTWTAGFLVFAAMAVLLAQSHPVQAAPPDEPRSDALQCTGDGRRVLWFLLPMAGALQLGAVTAHLTANVAAMPLLWVLPLAAYLVSFTVAFDRPNWYRRGLVVRLLVVLLASLAYLLSKTDVSLPIRLAVAFFVLELFVACVFLHAETYRLRPRHDGEAVVFYVLIAGGGAAGTLFVAVLSPLLFAASYDLPLAFLATAVLAGAVTWPEGWPQRLLWSVSSVLLLLLVGMLHVAGARNSLLQERNFYGTLRVRQTVDPASGMPLRTLLHGTIQHGTEIFRSGGSTLPTTYYAPHSGIGLLLRARPSSTGPWNVGVVGLGAGTLAAYGRSGDRLTFFEINPAIPPIAQNLFTYLRSSGATINVAPGDARTSLTRSNEQFDVLVIDAFSGDAIPLHLLTREAMTVYRQHLRPSGLLAFHISNQYVDLAPEVLRLAQSQGLAALEVNTPADTATGAFAATWIVVGTPDRLASVPDLVEHSQSISSEDRVPLWTDDYSSVLPLLR